MDAYQSYNALTEIARDNGPWQLVYCWTHVRRRFLKRFENEGSPIAEEILRQIALLYRVEKAVRGKYAALRLVARREHAGPSAPGRSHLRRRDPRAGAGSGAQNHEERLFLGRGVR